MLNREITRFAIVGSLTVLTDYIIYRSFLFLNLLGIDYAKAFGFIAGTFFAYFVNQYWTFERNRFGFQPFGRFILLYLVTGIVNVWINALTLSERYTPTFAFLLATGVSAMLNFIGMKLFVFNLKSTEVSPNKKELA